MSIGKNTISFSEITPIVRSLMKKKENYHLGILGKVSADGLNDLWYDVKNYEMRILIYKGGVVLERMRKMIDSEADEVIISEKFNFDEVPEKWALIRYMDYYEHLKEKEFKHFVDLSKYNTIIDDVVKKGL